MNKSRLFKLMIPIIDKMQRNNFYPLKNEDADVHHDLINEGFLCESSDGFLYITKQFIDKHYNELIMHGLSRYQIRALHDLELSPIFFRNEMLAQYLSNPNYHFQWNHYRGSIYSIDESDYVHLKNICFAYDLKNKKPIFAMFLGDVVKLDKDHQNYISRYEIANKNYLEVNREVVKNLIYGQRSRYSDLDIYSIVLHGMKICNELIFEKYKGYFFKDIKNINDYEYFHPIFIPSKVNFYLFSLEHYKIIYESINKKLVKKILNERDGLTKEVVKDIKMWDLISKVIQTDFNDFFERIDKIRNIPAHEIFKNELDENFWDEQDKTLILTYQFLNAIIVSLIGDYLPDRYKEYEEIYGRRGRIGNGNGFNKSPYSFYDGQLQLVSEVFRNRESEYLIAFKSIKKAKDNLSEYISKKRVDLNKKSIDCIVEKMLEKVDVKVNIRMVKSFFKGREFINNRINGVPCNKEVYIEEGEKAAMEFLKRYKLENIFVFADSVNPHFLNFDECLNDTEIVGKGYVTEMIHYFHNEYECNNVTTDSTEDSDIQILSNIWD